MTADYELGDVIVDIDLHMKRSGITVQELSKRVGITPANLSILKNNKARGVRFGTLLAICRELNCEPGDILKINK